MDALMRVAFATFFWLMVNKQCGEMKEMASRQATDSRACGLDPRDTIVLLCPVSRSTEWVAMLPVASFAVEY